MKKIILLLAAVAMVCGTASAQGWKDALKKTAEAAADKATDGKLTAHTLVGTWNYAKPGIKFEGDDMVSELGGAAAETAVQAKLEKAYEMAGIKAGACAFTFTADNNFTATMGHQHLSGTYEFDAQTHVITLHFAKDEHNLGSIPGHAYAGVGDLKLVFPVTKLVDVVTSLGSKISMLQEATTLLEKYKNFYLGFEFTK